MAKRDDYLSQSGYLPALRLERILSRRTAGIASFCLFVGAVLLFNVAMLNPLRQIFGLGLITTALFLCFLVYWLFVVYLQEEKNFTVDQLKQSLEHGMYGRGVSYFVSRIIYQSSRWDAVYLKILFFWLLETGQFNWFLRRWNIPKQSFVELVNKRYDKEASLSLDKVMRLAWQKTLALNHTRLRYTDFLIAVFELDEIFRSILFEFDIEEAELLGVASWQSRREHERDIRGKFWYRVNLLNTSGIGKDWSGGFTINLDQVAHDLSIGLRYGSSSTHLRGRRKQIGLLERMLIQPGGASNVVLVGEPGSGRRSIVEMFAHMSHIGKTLAPLRYKRFLEIDSSAILGGTKSVNETLDRIQVLFGEALRAENVILVINNFDAMLSPRGGAGRVDATEAIIPYLRSPLKVLGIMTPAGYQETIGKNQNLISLISKMEVSETDYEITLTILQDEVLSIERQSGLFFTYVALAEIVKLSEKLVQNLPNPEKSLDILERVAIFVATKTRDNIVTPDHVRTVISQQTKIPVEKVVGEEKQVLLNLENILHHRIVGQENAIKQIASALRRARSGIASDKRPMGSFLFLGPTGVGKTETTKALASVYFGGEDRMIRLDMSEFQEVHSVNRLIGDIDSREGGYLTEKVIADPFSLILLDELEKAHPKVLDIFLQVFDDGRLTDALGRKVSFVNTMIVATSNAGSELIRKMVREGKDPSQQQEMVLDNLQSNNIFRPEFLNRFDGVIIFHPLSNEELLKIAHLLLMELNERLSEKDIKVRITNELVAAVAEHGVSREFGARPLRRYIQEHIENLVAEQLISGTIQRGGEIEIFPESLE